MMRKEKPKLSNFWRYLTNLWTVVIFLGVVYDFWGDNAAREAIVPLAIIYVGVLAIYAGTKEFERWHQVHTSRHPGEIFVIFWTALLIIIVGADFLLDKAYVLPTEIIAVYMSVLGVLAITKRSKYLHELKGKSRKR